MIYKNNLQFHICLFRVSFLVFFFIGTYLPQASSNESLELNNQAVALAKEQKYEEAIRLLRKSRKINPTQTETNFNLSQMLMSYAVELYKDGDVRAAIKHLREAVSVDENNAPAWYMLGNLVYLNESDFQNAIKYWKTALTSAPSNIRKVIVERVKQAELDRSVERNYQVIETNHYSIRFEDPKLKDQIEELKNYFDEQYQRLAGELGVTPNQITVIIYPQTKFSRLSGKFDWAIGFYDGRIRLREDDLSKAWMKVVFVHELAHAFLQHGFGNSLPAWIHEGYAQAKEPDYPISSEEEAMMEALKNRTQWIPLEWLDKRFSQPVDSKDIMRAYAEARLVVKTLLEMSGAQKFQQFLKYMAQGSSQDAAYERAYSPAKWSRVNQGNFG